MGHRRRIYYSDSQKALMWKRWRQGDSLQKIAQLFDRHHPSVARILGEAGGIQSLHRRRADRALSRHECEEISHGLVAGRSLHSIAETLGRAASTVSREVARNGGSGAYRATQAERAAWDRAST